MVIAIEWPSYITAIPDQLGPWIAFDLELSSLACMGASHTLADRLALALFLSLALLAVPPIIYILCRAFFKLLPRKCAPSKSLLEAIFERCVSTYLLMTFIVHAPVASLGFRFFNCEWCADGYNNLLPTSYFLRPTSYFLPPSYFLHLAADSCSDCHVAGTPTAGTTDTTSR